METKFQFFDDAYVLERDESEESEDEESEERILKVRLDKWLWAARFFKTRAVARAAVEKGKVFYNGERARPSREIEIGAILQIRQGRFEKTVIVKGLSTRRRSTEEALTLFEETEESKALREHFVPEHDANPFYMSHHRSEHREEPYPTRERRVVRFLRRSVMPYDRTAPNPYQTQSTQSTRSTLKEVEIDPID